MIPDSPNYHGLGAEQGFAPSSDDAPSSISGMVSPKATFKDFEWLAGKTRLPMIAKGIMTAEDAVLAVESGVKAIIVSNHGGRSLDSTFATIEALPEVVDAVQGKAEVYLDGGIRRGSDIIKALALGARAVLIGRPIFWGLAAGGEQGLRDLLEILRDELHSTMGLCGKADIAGIDRSLVSTVSPLNSL